MQTFTFALLAMLGLQQAFASPVLERGDKEDKYSPKARFCLPFPLSLQISDPLPL